MEYKLLLYSIACVGDASKWNAGFGTCPTYKKPQPNHDFCDSDCVDGKCASQICPECGACTSMGILYSNLLTLTLTEYLNR